MVLDPGDCGKTGNARNKCWLFWFGEHTISQVDKGKIANLKESFSKNYKASPREQLRKSVEEMLGVLAVSNDMVGSPSSILKWALDGFQAVYWKVQFQWTKLGLPQVIQEALTEEMDTASEASDTEDTVIQDVRSGRMALDDICIGCCQKNMTIVAKHQMFIGGICKACRKDVSRICNLPCGKFQSHCIVCGQGGKLVYCDNNSCLRAYCQECVKYLDSETAFDQIQSNDDWKCYFCERNQNNSCLIKRRIPRPVVDSLASSASIPIQSATSMKMDKGKKKEVSKRKMSVKFKAEGKKKEVSKRKLYMKLKDGDSKGILKKKTPLKLKETCIACFKKKAKLTAYHPLFIGKVCKSCEKDVGKTCALPRGKLQDFCIVCGQGGDLVYCSKLACSRAYCELCIQYLDSDKAYDEIVDDDGWKCYLCETNQNKRCLIKARITYPAADSPASPTAQPLPSTSTSIKMDGDAKKMLKRKTSVEHKDGDAKKVSKEKTEISGLIDVIDDVRNGRKDLEDICIACCEGDVILISEHPLFYGKICESCDFDVRRSYKLPFGRFHDYCIICGLGGSLVFCYNRWCHRAYCKVCIEYMDSKKAFEKIANNDEWNCYICEPIDDDRCLIQAKTSDYKYRKMQAASKSQVPNTTDAGDPIKDVQKGKKSIEDLKGKADIFIISDKFLLW